MYPVSLALLLTALSLPGQPTATATNIDFRNFTYPFPDEASLRSVPSELVWLSQKVQRVITLTDGRWSANPSDPSRSPSVLLSDVHYGYLTASGKLDAMVVLGYYTGGTAQWSFLYAYGLETGAPKLLGWMRTGDRGLSGLRQLWVTTGQFTIDVWDPALKEADCCSDGFIRTTYEWRHGKFVASGPPLFGWPGEDPKPR